MIEFGSDFHYIQIGSQSENTLNSIFSNVNYYADGRQALIHLYQSQKWQRLWVPGYFCYDVISSWRDAGLEIVFYADWPTNHDDNLTLEAIREKGCFRSTDAIFRVNYFGMRSLRAIKNLPVAAVVEDHTHDIIGEWAIKSEADWCVASLRKTLPIAEGGILWSPLGFQLPEKPMFSDANEKIATIRWEAMRLKARYLAGEDIAKSTFRAGYLDTEDYFDKALVSSLDIKSHDYLMTFDIRNWYTRKFENWNNLRDIKAEGVRVIVPEGGNCYPFSLLLLFDSPLERDRVRKELIEHQIYPAILWNIPDSDNDAVRNFSNRMLSIHCDGRYSVEDIKQMKSIIESII